MLLSSWTLLLIDSPLTHSHGPKPASVIASFYKEVLSRSLGQTIKRYSDLFDEVVSSTSLSGGIPLAGEFITTMRDTPIFKEYHLWWRTNDPKLLSYILTFLKFLKKAKYVDDSFNAIAFRDWQEVEAGVSAQKIPDVSALRTIVEALLPTTLTDIPFPRFGPGAVSEDGIRGQRRKADNLHAHPRLRRTVESWSFKRLGIPPSRVFPWYDSPVSEAISTDVSTLRFVPKDVTKARSICMEPNSFMYHQQMVLDWIVRAMDKGMISQIVSLRDQTNSQLAALHGSTYGSVDTIDLSSASDSVHVDLVRKIFPREYWYWLLATRTSKVKTPDGNVVSVKKFAPMGSALCFPVQCIVFSAICVYAMLRNRGMISSLSDVLYPWQVQLFLNTEVYREYGPGTPYTNRYERLTIYGDDISCDSRITETVIEVLGLLGFKVNASKSFRSSQAVRESCGVYAFNGTDVTPLMCKPLFFSSGITPVVVASIIDLANQAGDHGYYHLRRYLIRIVRFSPIKGYERALKGGRGNPIPYTTDRATFGIYTKRCSNSHLVKGWNSDWQRYEERAWGMRSIWKREPHNIENLDFILYIQDQRSRRGDNQSEFALSRRVPQETRFHRVWSPVE